MPETIHLKGITWDHPRGYNCLVAVSKQYFLEHNVNVSWQVRSLQDFADVSIAQLAERFDLIVLDHPHVGQVAANGCLVPLPAPVDISSSSMGGSVESYFYSDQYWAYAIDASCQMATFRPDIDSPRPRHWQDFLNKDSRKYRALTPLKPVDALDMWLTLAASLDEKIPTSPETFINEPAALLGLDILKCLYRLGPAEAISWNPIQVLEVLSTTNEFAYSPCLFGYVNYCKPGFKKYRLAYSDLPCFAGQNTRRSILGGAGLAVSKNTADQAAAIHYAQWVASEPIQSGDYLSNDGQPAHRNTWLQKAADPIYGGFFGGAQKTMMTAWTRPREEWFLYFVDDACEIFPDFFNKNQSSRDFLRQINALYREHINKQNH